MLSKIIYYSIHNRLVILIAATLLLAGGIYVTRDMEVDVFPDLTAPTVVIMTEAHGMAPEEVERLVSFPIETAINGATHIRRVRSSSSMGFSIVWAEFDWGMDIYKARQVVTEKLATVADRMPEGVNNPTLAPQSSILGEVMIIALTADSTGMMDLRTLADWNLRPALLSVGGVAQVSVIGGAKKEYQVLADPFRMQYQQISLEELVQACRGMNDNAPGGFINEFGNEYLIRGVARTTDTVRMGETFVAMRNGQAVRIRDVARVCTGAAPRIGDASHDKQPAVILVITRQPDVNTLALNAQLKTMLSEVEKTLPPDVRIHTDIFDQSRFIQTAVNNVKKALIEGGIFVVIILFVFLMNFRTTLISVVAIPLSLLVAVLVLKLFGISINTMTLGGMTIAIGSLVDDAIIDVENVYRRLRENAALPEEIKRPALKVIYEASVEIRPSILNATFIIIVAFVPLFFLTGMEGRMLKPLGIAYVVSLFASLGVAITLIPVLGSYLLTREERLRKHPEGSRIEKFLRKHYASSLDFILANRIWVISGAVLLFLLSILLFAGFGRSFLPPFNEGSLTINTSTMPGVNLGESDKLGMKAEEALLSVPEILSTTRRTGRAELAEHTFGVNVSEIDAPFELKDRSRADFLKEVRAKLAAIPGIAIEVGQPLSHRIDAMLSGSKANIAIKLFGTDLNEMFSLANHIRDQISDIEGIGDLSVEQQIEIPQIQIIPNREMLSRYGIPVSGFLEFVDYAFGGQKLADVFEGEKAFDLVLRYDDRYRDRFMAIEQALIDTRNDGKIPLNQVAEIRSAFGPNTISRENVMRKIVVSVNVADRDVGSVVADIRDRIQESVRLPENYRIEYGGQFESQVQASRTLLLASIGALLFIFLLLYLEFRDAKLAGIILVNLPLALIGGVTAIWFSSGVISIPAIIGFITLFGIATRNGILLISRYQALQQEKGRLRDRVILGSTERLSPILMTALTAALALIPLALGGDKPGNEIQSPMAVVILGGLLSSTLLNIYVVPVIYYLMNFKKEPEHES